MKSMKETAGSRGTHTNSLIKINLDMDQRNRSSTDETITLINEQLMKSYYMTINIA